jgi:isopentenyl diphosphate isomerase/L-lactate dehydrogenase-like FMN-dependent dehydrogenase
MHTAAGDARDVFFKPPYYSYCFVSLNFDMLNYVYSLPIVIAAAAATAAAAAAATAAAATAAAAIIMIIISTTIIVKSRQVTWREKRIVEL